MSTGNDESTAVEATIGVESDVDSPAGEVEELSEAGLTGDLEAEVERTVGPTGKQWRSRTKALSQGKFYLLLFAWGGSGNPE